MIKAVTALAAAVAVWVVASAQSEPPVRSIITYRYEVQAGDTLWDIASKIAMPDEDVRELIHRIKVDNAIKNAPIRPGQELVIRVEGRK